MNYFTDRFTITKRSKSPEGYLLVQDSKLARVGVLNYRFGELGSIDGAPDTLKKLDEVRVYRGPEELFKAEVLDSFKSKPVTLSHPGELVDTETFKDASVGFSKDDLKGSGDFITASVLITDADAIKAVEDGTKELSLGYTARITWQPGTAPDGSVYDAVQTEIRGNHIAIVPRGRCGSVCTLSDSILKTKHKNKGTAMDEIILDGVTYECPAQTKQAFTKVNDALKVSLKDAEEKSEKSEKELEDEKEVAKKEKDEMQAKLDAAEENKIKDSDIDTLVEDRLQLVSDAQSIVKDMDCKGKSTAEIKLAVVTDACPNAKLDGKSPDYVAARFDGLLEDAPKGSAIKDAMTSHADGKIIVNDGLSISERKRLERITNNKKK